MNSEEIREYVKDVTIKRVVVIFTITLILTLFCEVQYLLSKNSPPIEAINRESPNSMDKEFKCHLEFEDEQKEINIQVGALEYKPEELDVLWSELSNTLPELILGENDKSRIDKDLSFKTEIEGYPFVLSYDSDDARIIDREGKLGDVIPKEGKDVVVNITAKYVQQSFNAQKQIELRVYPKDEMSGFVARLKDYIQEEEKETRHLDQVELPSSFEGKQLVWRESNENKSILVFLAGSLLILAVIIGRKEEEKKEEDRIRMEMEMTYPEVISRLAMYMGAGMTVSASFKRLGNTYENLDESKPNPLHKEIVLTCREMESGVSEIEALKNLAIRCHIPQITKLTSLIIQGSRRGSFGLKEALKEETKDALRERKAKAKIRGEQAGTKLLAPMMLMLIMVMAVIMIPAFTSFGL